MKVILASKNPHKLTELSAILSQHGFEIALESEYGLDIDVDETGTTFEENSLLKAEAVMKASGMPVLADDSVSWWTRWTARRVCIPHGTAINRPMASARHFCWRT